MKKQFSLILVLVLCLFGLVACKKQEEPTVEAAKNYTIKVVDIDGEVLVNKTYSTETYSSVLAALQGDCDVVGYSSPDYGYSITSIKGSIVDSNWYLASYENGAYATTGVEGLVIDDGDVFEFNATCWNTVAGGYGTMDETDVLIDKIIYSYMKQYFATVVSTSTNYATGDYWSMMAVNMMASNGYDSNLFNTNAVKQEYKDSLNVTDFSGVTGAAWGKYYYGAKACGLDLTNFKTAYAQYLSTLTSETYSEWSTPFYLSPAKSLEVSNDAVTALVNTEYVAGTGYGVDGWCWQMTNLSLWKNYTLEQLSAITAADQGNGTSTALMLLPLAANNINARTVKNAEGVDLIQILVNTYYDQELKLVKWSSADTAINYSTNQIYASLMAYKVQRDTAKAANLFA